MTRKYWQSVGGTLVEEFLLVKGSDTAGKRLVDGVIIKNEETKIAKTHEVDLAGKDVIVLQAKYKRLNMPVIGQAIISKLLIEKHYSPRSVTAVALCTQNDTELESIVHANFEGIHVHVHS